MTTMWHLHQLGGHSKSCLTTHHVFDVMHYTKKWIIT